MTWKIGTSKGGIYFIYDLCIHYELTALIERKKKIKIKHELYHESTITITGITNRKE